MEKQGYLFRRIGLGRQGTGFHTSGSPILQPIQDQREHDCRTKSTPSQKIACLEAVLNLSPKSTHENEHIKPRKTFWRNSKQLLILSPIPGRQSYSFPSLFFSSHCSRRRSGRCLMEKPSNRALKPFPSGQAPIMPTMTGQLSCNQALRIIVYSLSSKE